MSEQGASVKDAGEFSTSSASIPAPLAYFAKNLGFLLGFLENYSDIVQEYTGH